MIGEVWQTRRKSGASNEQSPRIWSGLGRRACALAIPWLLLCGGQLIHADERYAAPVDYMAHSPPIPPPPTPPQDGLVAALAFAAIVMLASPLVARYLNRRHDASKRRASFEPESLDRFYENEPSLAALFEELRTLEVQGKGATGDSQDETQSAENKPRAAPASLEEFFASARSQSGTFCSLFARANRAADVAVRQNLLLELADLLGAFKEECSLPGLKPLWRLVYALEALLKQLGRNEALISASALKSAAGALDLIKVLSGEELSAEIAADGPVRLLAVDDDPVCLCTLALALKKAFDPPDTAADGEAALALAAQQPYDVIFLDVEMPGVDGLELCKKIRQTELNHATPVVFVTRHSDFNSRARTAVAGGNELIGKPFLALEITVKALSLVLASRRKSKSPELNSANASADTAASGDDTHETPAMEGTQVHGGQRFRVEDAVLATTGRSDHEEVQFEKLTKRVDAAMLARDAAARQDLLGKLYIGVHGLTLQTERDGQKTAHRLSTTLEDLLRKLLEQPLLCTPFGLDAIKDALNLLGELHASGVDPEFVEDSFRILVVDDDPVALRAAAGSLQLVFGRPESAESGEAALELAGETAFDLILLDVIMPGMDGFEACAKILQTDANRETPVLFVTSRDDEPSRKQAFAAGGCGFITKPFLPKEILLRALTLMLRRRRISLSLACAY